MLNDASVVLGTLVGGPGSTTLACLGGAQVDRFGNLNSTLIPGGPFLVGSGGGNDVASVCAEAVVVALLAPERTPPECGYVTSPGRAVRALVTDLGTFEKAGDDRELVLTAVPAGPGTLDERIEAARRACGWDLAVADAVHELAPPTPAEIARLRSWDPRGWFLRER
jgi:acyl CoA:acetate/3-ketoacid CoA transferase beta subunit